jgi:ribosome-associated protein
VATVKKKPAAKPKKTTVKKAVAKKPSAKKIAPAKEKAKAPVAKKAAARSAGVPEKLLDAAMAVLDDRQAIDIVSVPLAGLSSIADYMIIASGKTGRQVAALADHVSEAFSKAGASFVQIEGKENANWVLVDCGDVIVHLFLPEVRQYYDLDTLWDKRTSRK